MNDSECRINGFGRGIRKTTQGEACGRERRATEETAQGGFFEACGEGRRRGAVGKSAVTARLFGYDSAYGAAVVAGMDEAGRGPLAGPVVCACCVMDMRGGRFIDGINDSKRVSERLREELYGLITAGALDYCVARESEETIDRINILNATKLCMKSAAEGLKITPDVLLVDAVTGLDIKIKYVPIIRGDAASYNIAAASILAKVTRDRLMREYDKIYPEYGFTANKGYGTARHIAALKKYGPSPIHRKTFIKNFVCGGAEGSLSV
ncbi:MAG: ribonuclease HII [Clostridiales bacterium]|jgi:ribonuclease HII|nr:ribonuclease HII [Clostridiales bacterium]